MVLQGREVSEADVGLIRGLLRESTSLGPDSTERGALPALGLAQTRGAGSRRWRRVRSC